MAELKYVDWDGLVYYDGKNKQYIDDKLSDCIKVGGEVSFEDLPSPSYQNLNFVYKVTEEFTSNTLFDNPGRIYSANTWVQVTDIDNVYLYTIFNESDKAVGEINSNIDALSDRIDGQDEKLDKVTTDLTVLDGEVDTLNTFVAELANKVSTDADAFSNLNEEIDDLRTVILSTAADVSDLHRAVEENIDDVSALETKTSDMEVRLHSVEDTLASVVDDTQANTSQIESMFTIVTNDHVRVDETIETVNTFEGRVAIAESHVKENSDDIDTLQADVVKAQLTADGATTAATVAQDTANEAKSQIAVVEHLIDDNKASIDALGSEVSVLREEVTSVSETATNAENLAGEANSRSTENATNIETLRTYVDESLADVSVALSGYYNKDETDEAIKKAINEASLSGGDQPVDLSIYYTKTEADGKFLQEVPEEYITETELNSKNYLTVTSAEEQFAKISDIPSTDGFLTEIPEEYITTDELADYALKSDIPTNYLTEIPAEYITESELDSKGYLTAHQDISGKADVTELTALAETVETLSDSVTNKADAVHTHAYTDLTDRPDLSIYATTESLNAKADTTHEHSEYALKEDIPTVPTKVSELDNDKNYLTAVPDEYITSDELSTELEKKANATHTHTLSEITDYSPTNLDNYYDKDTVDEMVNAKQDELVSGDNIATINGKSLLDGGNIEIAGGTISSPDDIILNFTEPTVNAIGGVAAGTVISNWSLTKLIQTMFFGSTEPEDVPVTDKIVEQSIPILSGDVDGVTATEFIIADNATKTVSGQKVDETPSTSCYYIARDGSGEIVEQGYQILTDDTGRDEYSMALPEGATLTNVYIWDSLTSSWLEFNGTFTPGEIVESNGFTYTIYVSSDSSSSDIYRFVIE